MTSSFLYPQCEKLQGQPVYGLNYLPIGHQHRFQAHQVLLVYGSTRASEAGMDAARAYSLSRIVSMPHQPFLVYSRICFVEVRIMVMLPFVW